MNVIAPSGFFAFLATNRPDPSPAGRYGGAVNGREREEADFEILNSLDNLRHEPRAGGQHGSISRIKQRVGIVVGDAVYALRVVTALHEVSEEEVDGLHNLGGVPPTVSVEEVDQSFST